MKRARALSALAGVLLLAGLPFAQGAMDAAPGEAQGVGVAATSGTVVYAAPFDYGMYDYHGGAIHKVGVSRLTGFMQYGMHVKTLYDDWTPWAYTAIGSQHNVYSDWMLPSSYAAPVTITLDYAGIISCEGAAWEADGKARVMIQQQVWRSGAWTDVATRTVEEMGCGTIRNSPRTLEKSADFTFEAGNIYRLLAKVDYTAQVWGGGVVDILFCKDTWLCDSWGGKGWVLQSISIPNQVPAARFYDVSTNYLSNLVWGVSVSGRGCDIDGRTNVIVLTVGGSTYRRDDGSTSCLSHAQATRFLVWGTYSASAAVRDSAYAWKTDYGTVHIGLFSASATSVDPGVVGHDVVVDTLLDREGAVKGTRVASDGRVLLDTWADVERAPTDHVGRIVLDRDAGHATVTLDGAIAWSGTVAQAGREWWNVEPACAVTDGDACSATRAAAVPDLGVSL